MCFTLSNIVSGFFYSFVLSGGPHTSHFFSQTHTKTKSAFMQKKSRKTIYLLKCVAKFTLLIFDLDTLFTYLKYILYFVNALV